MGMALFAERILCLTSNNETYYRNSYDIAVCAKPFKCRSCVCIYRAWFWSPLPLDIIAPNNFRPSANTVLTTKTKGFYLLLMISWCPFDNLMTHLKIYDEISRSLTALRALILQAVMSMGIIENTSDMVISLFSHWSWNKMNLDKPIVRNPVWLVSYPNQNKAN